MAAERRSFTDAERAAVVEGFRGWTGTQTAYAEASGLSQTTVSRWLNAEKRARRKGGTPAVRQRSPAPAMVEVTTFPSPVPAKPHPSGARLVLGDGVALVFEALPPARWLAEVATELRRC